MPELSGKIGREPHGAKAAEVYGIVGYLLSTAFFREHFQSMLRFLSIFQPARFVTGHCACIHYEYLDSISERPNLSHVTLPQDG